MTTVGKKPLAHKSPAQDRGPVGAQAQPTVTSTKPPVAQGASSSSDAAVSATSRNGDGHETRGNHHFQRYVPSRSQGTSPKAQGHEELKATSLVELRARGETDTLDGIFQKHLADFRTAFAEMRKQPPSVVVFGGARLKPGDRYYQMAERLGAALADWGIPPKTGAGPGAMHAVPAGYIAARDSRTIQVVQTLVDGVSRLADLDSKKTLGFNIKLPAEQKVSPSIESHAEIQQFAFRKFALYENVRGGAIMPGGFGTVDELMEVLVLRAAGRTRDPMVFLGVDYWQPVFDAMRASATREGRDLLGGLLDGVLVTDDVNKAVEFIATADGVKAFDEDPDELYVKMVREIKLAKYVATHQEPAVAVLGGDDLAPGDKALRILGEVAQRLGYDDVPVRVGHKGQVEKILEEHHDGVQKVVWDPDAAPAAKSKRPDANDATFTERIPHKEALLRNASAYVVAPCGHRGKDEFTTVLCQIQTGKLPPRPIVLVDSAYWKPIVESWEKQMIGPNHGYIEHEDVKLVTFADSADDVMKALKG
jgi:hypothetical protein